jgi:TonB family C-terminal domain
MVMPTYPQLASRANIEGKVTVDVELDMEGKVVSAKAASGHQMLRQAAEDAAKRSRFKPPTFDGTPIRAKGVIVYNFNLKAGTE